MNSSNRISSLDALKGVGALCVIMGHYGFEGIKNSVVQNIIGNGVRAVQLFFIVSTFLCLKSIDTHNPKSFKDYVAWLWKNLIRIAPLWYFALLIYGLWPNIAGWGGYSASRTTVTIANYISHFLFISGLVPEFSNTIINIGWYVGALVILYLLVMLYHKLKGRLKPELLFLISTFICLASMLCSLAFKSSSSVAYFRRFSLWAQFPVIAIGIIVFDLYNHMDDVSITMRHNIAKILKYISSVLLVSLLTVNLASPVHLAKFHLGFVLACL